MKNKFDETYQKIISEMKLVRQYQCQQPMETYSNQNITIGDVILESVLPSPYMLINDIIQNLKNGKNQFSYNKHYLKKLSDKDWKYYSLIQKLPDDFSLTILKCEEFQIIKKFKNVKPQGMMMQFCPDKNFNEFVWIGNYFNQYDEGFKNLLKHQLGHVWTFIFGTLDDDFKDGQGPSNQKLKLDPTKFNQYQKDIFINLYNKNLNVLNFDYNYVLCKTDQNDTANYQIATNIDNIIEILIADYLENHIEINTNNYMKNLFKILENNDKAYSFNDLSLLKHFKNNKKFEQYSNIQSIKNPIRRLFLIFVFGTKEQINYFKKQCEKEFGKNLNEE